jgi:hypothetical protein
MVPAEEQGRIHAWRVAESKSRAFCLFHFSEMREFPGKSEGYL